MKRIFEFTAILIIVSGLKVNAFGYSLINHFSVNAHIHKEFKLKSTQSNALVQSIIVGKVIDEEDNPIAGVSILLKGTKTGTITNDKGIFSIESVIGNSLIFSAIGYETKEIKITVTSIIIKLLFKIRTLDELVVSGNVVATKRAADVSSVTVLTGKDIKALPGFNLTNILEGVVPGVTVTSIGTNLFRVGEYFRSSIQVRGADIKVYVDGVVYASGSAYLAMINKDDIDRIEIVRGPSAATLYGSGAIGGVMLIYTKKGSGDKASINLKTSFGFQQSDYTEKKKQFQQEHSAEFYQGIKNFRYVIGGNYRTQDDYLPNGSSTVGGGFANFTYYTGKFKFVFGNNYNSNKIIPSRLPVFDTISGVGDFFWLYKYSGSSKESYQIQSGTISLNTSFQSNSWWTHNLILGYSKNAYHLLYDGSVFTDTALINYYAIHNDEYDAQEWISKDKTPTLSYNNFIKVGNLHDPFKMNILSGFEYSNSKHDEVIYNNILHYTTAGGFTYNPNRITGAPFYNYNREFTGAFLQLSPSLIDKYFLVAGLRYEKSNVSIAVVNPRIGFTTNFELSHFIIKPHINWGKSITPPPYYITHVRPPFGLATFVANPDIKPKEQSGIDAAIEVYDKNNKLKIEIVRYDNIIRNDFATKRTYNNNGTAVIISYINIGKYAHKGWEFSADYKINNFKIAGNYSIINATYIDSFIGRKTFYKSDRLDFIPNYAAGASLNYDFPKLFGKSDDITITVGMTSSGKLIASNDYQSLIDNVRWDAGNGPDPSSNDYYRETPIVTKYNLNVDYQFLPSLKFFIQAWNFTNNTTPDWDKSFPVPGAQWIFGLNMNFSEKTK